MEQVGGPVTSFQNQRRDWPNLHFSILLFCWLGCGRLVQVIASPQAHGHQRVFHCTRLRLLSTVQLFDILANVHAHNVSYGAGVSGHRITKEHLKYLHRHTSS